ncbi:hypothetical protein COO60DRAFT_1560775, partial [Scenedesmus sp. NREL 46B-D3]
MKLLAGSGTGCGSSGSSGAAYRRHEPQPPLPPVLLPALSELSLSDCAGVQAAVIGCFAHSTGLQTLQLCVRSEAPPLPLAAIAWMWPRLRSVQLSELWYSSSLYGSSQQRSTVGLRLAPGVTAAGLPGAAGDTGAGSSSSSSSAAAFTLPDLVDPRLSAELVAAWLWGCSYSGDSSS